MRGPGCRSGGRASLSLSRDGLPKRKEGRPSRADLYSGRLPNGIATVTMPCVYFYSRRPRKRLGGRGQRTLGPSAPGDAPQGFSTPLRPHRSPGDQGPHLPPVRPAGKLPAGGRPCWPCPPPPPGHGSRSSKSLTEGQNGRARNQARELLQPRPEEASNLGRTRALRPVRRSFWRQEKTQHRCPSQRLCLSLGKHDSVPRELYLIYVLLSFILGV